MNNTRQAIIGKLNIATLLIAANAQINLFKNTKDVQYLNDFESPKDLPGSIKNLTEGSSLVVLCRQPVRPNKEYKDIHSLPVIYDKPVNDNTDFVKVYSQEYINKITEGLENVFTTYILGDDKQYANVALIYKSDPEKKSEEQDPETEKIEEGNTILQPESLEKSENVVEFNMLNSQDEKTQTPKRVRKKQSKNNNNLSFTGDN